VARAGAVAYVTARLIDDPHLCARTLCDELEDLCYTPVISNADPPNPRSESAAGLPAMSDRDQPPERDYRPPRR
jgi:hypothetical protein